MTRSILTRALAVALSACLAAPAGAFTPASSQAEDAQTNQDGAYDANAHPSGFVAPVVPGSTRSQAAALKMTRTASTKVEGGEPPAAGGDSAAKKKPGLFSRLAKPLLGAGAVAAFAGAAFLAGGPMAGLAALGVGAAVLLGMAFMQGCGGGK